MLVAERNQERREEGVPLTRREGVRILVIQNTFGQFGCASGTMCPIPYLPPKNFSCQRLGRGRPRTKSEKNGLRDNFLEDVAKSCPLETRAMPGKICPHCLRKMISALIFLIMILYFLSFSEIFASIFLAKRPKKE